VILLWGLSGDDPLDDVAEELERTGTAFVHLDQRRVLESHVELAPNGASGRVTAPGIDLALADVSALYIRSYDGRGLASVRDGGAAALAHLDGVESALWCFADVAPIRVLNRPSAMCSNNSKPYQATLIRAHGFEVPESVITTDPDAAMAFWRRHRSVIYKSISGVRSIVSRLTSAHLERLADVQWCPTQLQEHVQGRDYRVHVVGTSVFPTAVISAADDYRYAGRQGIDVAFEPCDLPPEIAERCIQLAAHLGLPLSGLDLRRSVDDRWYCFEVNPSPCFTFYERQTQQPMTREVASYLAHQ
jgi:hypothetical protein